MRIFRKWKYYWEMTPEEQKEHHKARIRAEAERQIDDEVFREEVDKMKDKIRAEREAGDKDVGEKNKQTP